MSRHSCIALVEMNYHGAWVIYGDIGIQQFYGYSKREAMARYRRQCKEADALANKNY